ncbi:SpoIIE family protein phosphatase [Nocardioides sp. Arc9.136]|uniref:SpoIIE family protein phosphatase n=1 Tax=Nocardioides sp. Arc9.136 TaxID=2996826 RepID=UPI002665F369|nr:SpoIIE family protein phosphatase [Nocardioides sp. Arc9.136]WKN50141.1 SpoIIE family protein phosphatase [Nocardioides sp. Arc9.136]
MSSAEAASDLHAVIGDAPAAVLVVDLARGAVVHANDVAQQLAPALRLPVALDRWSDAARLRDPAGTELSDSEHPLTRLLRSEPVPGQRVSAERRSELGASREPLWVVGLPMTGAPMLDDHALVVFLPVRERHATAAVEAFADQDARVRDRAVLATGLSFTVADASDPDLPLIWVNPAFTATSGYEFGEAVGRNCRFLQGPDTDRAEVRRVRTALEAGEAVTATLLNYRKDGLAFWNQVTMSPILGDSGTVTHFVGVQSDVSGRIESDRQRDAALAAEQRARTRAEESQARLRLLAGASESLSGELDIDEARTRLLQLLVPALADMAVFVHVDENGAVTDHRAVHRDPDRSEALGRVAARVPDVVPPQGLVVALLDGRPYRQLDAFPPEVAGDLDVGSALAVALPGRLGVRDLVLLGRTADRSPFTADDADVAVDLGRRAGLILDNLRLYAAQRLIAQTLQRSLLPQLPELTGVGIEARYLPGADGAEVGGDFYEVVELPAGDPTGDAAPDGRTPFGLAVGDVAGHDVYAAAAMGQLKGVLRATATSQRLMPAAVLEHVDELLPALNVTSPLATMLFAHFEPLAGGSWQLTVSSAGHPPLVVRHPDGRAELLDPDRARGPILGFDIVTRGEVSVVLEPGTTVVAYTDGLVERRGEPLDVGFERLRVAVAAGPGVRTDQVIEALADPREDVGGSDDVVLVAVHLLG